MYPRNLQLQLAPIFLALLLVPPDAGCGQPGQGPSKPTFEDPPIHCSAALVRGISQTLVTKRLLLPAGSASRSFYEDFDGDGLMENQFKSLINIASLGGFDLSAVLASENQAGRHLLLLELFTPDLEQADCASLTIRRAPAPGPAAPPPKFDGSDVFQATDPVTTTFYGRIDHFVFQSFRPRGQTAELEQSWPLTIHLPILGRKTLAMPLRGVSVRAVLQVDAQRRLVGLTQANIYGVLPDEKMRDTLVPAVAEVLTDAIHGSSDAEYRRGLLVLFEPTDSQISKDKCRVMGDCCASAPGTCKILPAEVLKSPVGGVLSSDVEVFADDGSWRPVPRGRGFDGYSVGLGFEAVRATF